MRRSVAATARPARRAGGHARLGLALALALSLPAAPVLAAGEAQASTAVGHPHGPAPAQGEEEQHTCSDEETFWEEEPPTAIAGLGFDRAATLIHGEPGQGVTVAVVDSGIAADNEHFPPGSVLRGVNLVKKKKPATEDIYGHGTAVAGIIGARPLDESGVVGAAPGVSLLPIRVGYGEDEEDSTEYEDRDWLPTPARVAAGIEAAADAGAQVIAISMSMTDDDPRVRSAVRHAQSAGALIVASAGNAEEDVATGVRYPAGYDGVIGVAATDEAGVAVPEAGNPGEWVDLAAPGQNVGTAWYYGKDCRVSEQPQASYAVPYVAAAAALVAQRFPDESAQEWAYRLTATATGAVADHRDDVVGWGLVQPYAALTLVIDGTALGPVPPGVTPVEPDPPTSRPVDLSTPEDPMVPARALVGWVVMGGVAFTAIALLLGRLQRRRRT